MSPKRCRRKGKDGAARAYRAVMKREKPLGTDEVIKECVEGAGLEKKMAGQVRRNFEMVLDSMIAHTLQDGRTRRIGDYFSLRLDITGSFDRPDAQFDPAKHSLTLNFVTSTRLLTVGSSICSPASICVSEQDDF